MKLILTVFVFPFLIIVAAQEKKSKAEYCKDRLKAVQDVCAKKDQLLPCLEAYFDYGINCRLNLELVVQAVRYLDSHTIPEIPFGRDSNEAVKFFRDHQYTYPEVWKEIQAALKVIVSNPMAYSKDGYNF